METAVAPAEPRCKARPTSSFCFLSCFGGASPVSDPVAEASLPAPKLLRSRSWWSRIRGKKKTVPVDVVAGSDEPSPESSKSESSSSTAEMNQKKSERRKSLFRILIFHKVKSSKPRRQPHQLQNPPVHQVVSSKNRTRPELSVLHRVRDLARTETIKSYRSSPEPGQRATSISSPLAGGRSPRASGFGNKKPSARAGQDSSNSDSVFGLVIVAVTLVLLLVSSRFGVILCLCAMFYLLPHFRQPPAARGGGGISRRKDGGMIRVYRSSKEYKKMIVLSGLLERDGGRATPRRPN